MSSGRSINVVLVSIGINGVVGVELGGKGEGDSNEDQCFLLNADGRALNVAVSSGQCMVDTFSPNAEPPERASVTMPKNAHRSKPTGLLDLDPLGPLSIIRGFFMVIIHHNK